MGSQESHISKPHCKPNEPALRCAHAVHAQATNTMPGNATPIQGACCAAAELHPHFHASICLWMHCWRMRGAQCYCRAQLCQHQVMPSEGICVYPRAKPHIRPACMHPPRTMNAAAQSPTPVAAQKSPTPNTLACKKAQKAPTLHGFKPPWQHRPVRCSSGQHPDQT